MAENVNVQKKNASSGEHGIELRLRKYMKITGVRDVVGFDSTYAELSTACGVLYIDGENIKIGILDTDSGVVELEGSISAVTYSDGETKEKKGFFGRLR